jgi:hypothetical protein
MNFKLTKEHVKEAIEQTPKFTFLKKIVEDIKLHDTETVYVLHKNGATNKFSYVKQDEVSFKRNLKRTARELESDSDPQDEYEYKGNLSYVQDMQT